MNVISNFEESNFKKVFQLCTICNYNIIWWKHLDTTERQQQKHQVLEMLETDAVILCHINVCKMRFNNEHGNKKVM